MYDIELRYVANFSVTGFHAVSHVLRYGELADPDMAAALDSSIHTMRAMLESYAEPTRAFAKHAPPLAGQIDNNIQLGNVLFRKCTLGDDNPLRDQAFARAATELEHAIKNFAPDLLDEMEASVNPLRVEWETWGPQLLTAFAHQTSPQMLVPRADVFLSPVVAGVGGRAYLPYNSVLMEMTAGEDSGPLFGGQIPERIFTLCWLLGQLNLDLPMYSDNLSRGGYEKVGALAIIPALLSAAESKGVGQCSLESVTERLNAWLPEFASVETANTVWNWWQTYTNGDTTWGVALIALDRMLHPACPRTSTDCAPAENAGPPPVQDIMLEPL